jgi:hypothetical protein
MFKKGNFCVLNNKFSEKRGKKWSWNVSKSFSSLMSGYFNLWVVYTTYTFISRILRFINWIIISIFGISIIDNFNLRGYVSELKFIIATVTAYITTTQFYVSLRNMWIGLGLTSIQSNYTRELSTHENFSRETTKSETNIRQSIRNPKIYKND